MVKKTTKNTVRPRATSNQQLARDERQPFKWFDEYRDCFSGKMVPVSELFIDRLSQDVIDWAIKEEKAISFAAFLNSKGILRNAFMGWVAKHEKLKAAYEFALQCLAVRREYGAATGGYNPNIIMYMQSFYCSEWKSQTEWRAKLKTEMNENSGTKIVVMEKFDSSDLVPERVKK